MRAEDLPGSQISAHWLAGWRAGGLAGCGCESDAVCERAVGGAGADADATGMVLGGCPGSWVQGLVTGFQSPGLSD